MLEKQIEILDKMISGVITSFFVFLNLVIKSAFNSSFPGVFCSKATLVFSEADCFFTIEADGIIVLIIEFVSYRKVGKNKMKNSKLVSSSWGQ